MKKFTSVLAGLAMCGASFAQMASGSICPDFTGTDLNGNVWNLYTLLDEGKTVYVDVSATWCGPCWNYHQGGALETLWEEHGPDGDNTAMVLWIEGDNATTLADLQGTGGNTQGDWVTGTGFPIIDDASIANLLQISYFPTIYRICPDRLIFEDGQQSAANLYAGASNCDMLVGANNAAIYTSGMSTDAFCDNETREVTAVLRNMGSAPLTSCDVILRQNGNTIQTLPWTGNLGTYEMVEIDLNNITLTGTSAGIEIIASNPNGSSDENTDNDKWDAALSGAEVVNTAQVVLEIKTDQYGGELYWQIETASGLFFSGGNATIGIDGGGQYANPPADPGAYGNSTTITETLDLNIWDDCIKVNVVDGYGDGICCNYGSGYVKVKVNGTTIYNFTDFGPEDSGNMFNNLATGTEDVSGLSVSVFPNPADNLVNVDMVLGQSAKLNVEVMNAIGQRIETVATTNFMAGKNTVSINTANYADGVYFVVIRDENGTTTTRFTVAH